MQVQRPQAGRTVNTMPLFMWLCIHMCLSPTLSAPPPLVKPCAVKTCGVCRCNTACHPCQQTRELGDAQRFHLPYAAELLRTCKQTHTEHMQHAHRRATLQGFICCEPKHKPNTGGTTPLPTCWSETYQPHPYIHGKQLDSQQLQQL